METKKGLSGRQFPEEKEGFKYFKKPWIFSCTVEGKPLTATVTGWYDLPIQYAFHVRFSDTFSAKFITTEGGWWAEKKGGKPYVDAIKGQLNDLLLRTGS